MRLAIEAAGHSRPEDDRPHPKVGGVVVKNGSIPAKAHRGDGEHAEFVALERRLNHHVIADATVYTPLEPCNQGNPPKIAGGQGYDALPDAGIEVAIASASPNNSATQFGTPSQFSRESTVASHAQLPTALSPVELKYRDR